MLCPLKWLIFKMYTYIIASYKVSNFCQYFKMAHTTSKQISPNDVMSPMNDQQIIITTAISFIQVQWMINKLHQFNEWLINDYHLLVTHYEWLPFVNHSLNGWQTNCINEWWKYDLLDICSSFWYHLLNFFFVWVLFINFN